MKWRCLAFGVFFLGCGEVAVTSPDPMIHETSGVALELLYFVQSPTGRTLFGGLKGSISDPTAAWSFRSELGEDHPVSASASGAFELEIEDSERGTFHRGETPIAEFLRRDVAVARERAVWPPIGGAGSVPNDLVFVGQGPEARLVLVRSGDHAVSVFDLERGLDADLGLRLPEQVRSTGPIGAQPWFGAALSDGERIVVTAFLQHRAYLIHVPSLSVEAELRVESTVVLEPPMSLPYAIDLDGSGSSRTEVSRYAPRCPQGVAVSGDHVFVAYSGFVAPRLSPTRPPVYLPGVLARFSISDLAAAPKIAVLPLLNPQAVTFDSARGRVLVTASGVLDTSPELTPITMGGVMLVDPDTMTIEETFELPDFAPGSALIAGDSLWVSSLVSPTVRWVPLGGGSGGEIRLNDERVDSVFRLVELQGGLIGAPSFNTDRLHFIDPESKQLDPSPFFGPLSLGPGRPIFDGLQVLARRPGRAGVDFAGPDLFALSGIASRVVPVEFRKVLGP